MKNIYAISEYRPTPKPEAERSPDIEKYIPMIMNIAVFVLITWIIGAIIVKILEKIGEKRQKKTEKQKKSDKNC